MTAVCPPDGDLDRLLGDRLSAAEESALEAHVSGCPDCQARLDRLTGGSLTLPPGAALSGEAGTSPQAGVAERVAALTPVQARLFEQRPATVGANGAAAGPRFTVLGPHAQGGLGRVHVARDEQLRRTVALKDIRPERADDPAVRQRFLTEAEITGQLEHPGIVPIYALEHDAAGRPVYAMRFIRGRTLTDAIRAHHRRPTALGLRELLQRFISVCQTAAYAHSRGVIHRDLKPDNVMLGDYGETLVVDWGLAKRLGDRDDAFAVGAPEPGGGDARPGQLGETLVAETPGGGARGSDQLTAAGQVMGTPAYMAPEQARGEPLGPAADVFSLGAVLFALLTGKGPYQGTSALEVLRKVAAGERPAVAGAPRALNAIYFRAMAPDPAARYATAAELARDVERWLADEPVSAYREPWAARAGRWARRHRTLVTSLGVGAALLVATGVGVGWWQSRLAQERRAEQARAGEQVEALLDRCEAAVAADDAAAARLAIEDAEAHAENPGADHLRERLARARAAADLLADLDRIDDLRWDPENGKVQGTARAVREWPAAFARLGVVLHQTPPAEAAVRVNGSPVRERLLAALDLWLLHAPGPDRAAVAALLGAADADPFRDAVRSAVARPDLDAVKAFAGQEEALRQPAWFAAALGSIGELPRERRLSVLGTAARARPRDFALLMTAGNVYRINDPTTAADRLGWLRAAAAVRPASPVAHTNLGAALRDNGDLEGAVTELRTAVALDPNYAMAHNNLGVALIALGDRDGAIAEYRTAIRLDPQLFVAHSNLGNALNALGDRDGAVTEFRAAISLDPKQAAPHYNLGYVLQRKGDLRGAIAEYRAALAIDPQHVSARTNLGIALQSNGDVDGAVTEFRAVTALDPKHVVARYNLGFALQRKGDLKGAIAEYRATLAVDPKHRSALNNLGDALKATGDLKEAIALYQEAGRLAPKDTGLSQRRAEAERWLALLPRLDDMATGKAEPATAAQAVEYSTLCRQPFVKRYAASARLYTWACAKDRKYVDDASTLAARHAAARSAALAGCGQGADAPADASARAALRGQARAWLEANRKLLARRLESGKPADRKAVADQLTAWSNEKDLAGVRAGADRDGWSPAEAAAWNAFWSDVDALLARAKEVPPDGP